MRQGRQPKVTEQHLLLSAYQDVLRLDITVNVLALMRIMQARCHLLDRGENLRQRHHRALGIAPSQGTSRRVIHHQKRHPVLHIIIQDAYNRGMHQRGNRLGFLLEVLDLLLSQMRMQHFDGRLQIEPHMLP